MKEKTMATVHDVAAYILKKQGSMTTMKLQKLVYYCQAWSLVWDDKALFPEKIQAWANGPVVADLYEVHRGKYSVGSWTRGNCKKLSEIQRETIDAVLGYYGDKSSQWLSDLTHKENPWLNARKGLPSGARGSKVITHASMAEYYEALA